MDGGDGWDIGFEDGGFTTPMDKMEWMGYAATGWTGWMGYAARHGASDAIVILLEHGADISAVNIKVETPMFTALLSGNLGSDTVVALLLEHGVDIDAKNREGLTACQFASGYISEIPARVIG